jgi:hypothetical protein
MVGAGRGERARNAEENDGAAVIFQDLYFGALSLTGVRSSLQAVRVNSLPAGFTFREVGGGEVEISANLQGYPPS